MNRLERLLLASAAACMPCVALAQHFPSKPIRFLVGFAPGGSTDIVARLLAQKMSDSMGQQVVVENRPGAGSNIAAEALAKSPPDGYTILACTTGLFAIQPFLFKKLPYDPEKDLLPVTQTGSLPYIVVVHPSLPVKGVAEFVALAKRRPGELNYASSGVGTASHLSAEYFRTAAGIHIVHVPYKGTGQAMSDLLGGQVVLMFDQPVSSLPHVKAGKLKVLGISSGKRFPTLPEIPTVAEQGMPGFEAISWAGVCAPGRTPPEIVARLNAEVVKALKAPDVSERLLRDGIEPIGSSPEAFRAHTRREREKWGKVVRDSGARVD
jgi:tripartite-type tricarboxylate transporter receptor subunit TctC